MLDKLPYPFCTGCFFSTAVGELRSYENPKNKVTAVPAEEEEIWGAKFKVTPCYSNSGVGAGYIYVSDMSVLKFF